MVRRAGLARVPVRIGTVCGRVPKRIACGVPLNAEMNITAMSDSSWQLLVTVFDTLSAQVLIERLNSEGVPTRLRTDSPLFGVARACEIRVPAESLHRARLVLSSGQLSDSELAYLATGEVGSDRIDKS